MPGAARRSQATVGRASRSGFDAIRLALPPLPGDRRTSDDFGARGFHTFSIAPLRAFGLRMSLVVMGNANS
jgi:hypothetical protein